MHQILITFLLALALFHGMPRLSCACNVGLADASATQSAVQNPAQASVAQHHSCCEKTGDAAACNGIQFSQSKPCCGMMSPASPGLATSLSLLPDYNPTLVVVELANKSSLELEPASAQKLSRLNRAPPWQKGIGSSKTYLYKHSFLI